MTSLYFVRHAQPDYRTGVDSTYALSAEGIEDRMQACNTLKDIRLDVCVCSPYRRSIDTVIPIVQGHNLEIITDIRLRERDKGKGISNTHEMFRKRWKDFSFCEEGGESLSECQKRNIEAVKDILKKYENKNVLIGTHGTALSTIINYYDDSFGIEYFLRIINYMPYVVRLDFINDKFAGMEELAFVEKEFHGQKQ